MLKKIVAFVILSMGLSGVCFGFDLYLQADIQPTEAIVVKGAVGNFTGVVPQGKYEDSITANCWNIANPIEVILAVTANRTTAKLIVYTNHRSEDYWKNSVTANALPVAYDVSVNALVNVAAITTQNIYMTSIGMRAFADVWKENKPTTNNSAWHWVKNTPKAITYPTSNATVDPMYEGIIYDDNLKVYLRTAWDLPKAAGHYDTGLWFGLNSQ